MLDPSSSSELPAIPGKRYFTIGEVSDLCGVKPHVLRYWEQEFPTLKPLKRRGNRRYYQRQDVILIRQIRSLLYEHGFTIGGVAAFDCDDPEAVVSPGGVGFDINCGVRLLERSFLKETFPNIARRSRSSCSTTSPLVWVLEASYPPRRPRWMRRWNWAWTGH